MNTARFAYALVDVTTKNIEVSSIRGTRGEVRRLLPDYPDGAFSVERVKIRSQHE